MADYKDLRYVFPASSIASGTISNSRLNITDFDDNKILNDLSTLGLRVHTQENLNASNSNSASFDVFQDSSGITNLTNASRNSSEYVASSVSVPATEVLMKFEETSGTFSNDGIGAQSGQTLTIPNALSTTTNSKFGSRALHVNQATGRSVKLTGTNLITSSSDFTVEFFQNNNGLPSGVQDYTAYWSIQTSTSGGTNLDGLQLRANFASENIRVYYPSAQLDIGSANDTTWRHHAYSRVNGTTSYWFDGTRQFSFSDTQVYDGVSIGNKVTDDTDDRFIQYVDDVLICTTVGKYDPTQSSITVPTSTLTGLNGSSVSATGSFEGVAITAGASTSKMGAVITYQDNAGTNALNTDIILKLSADNGSNYSTATLTALPDFATGIKMAKVNDLSVTAGTQLKYKIEFANQALASKEARIRGVSLQY